jgi:hypothetical protein
MDVRQCRSGQWTEARVFLFKEGKGTQGNESEGEDNALQHQGMLLSIVFMYSFFFFWIFCFSLLLVDLFPFLLCRF